MCVWGGGAARKRREGNADFLTALRMKRRLLNNGPQGPHVSWPPTALPSVLASQLSHLFIPQWAAMSSSPWGICTWAFLVKECPFLASPNPSQLNFNLKCASLFFSSSVLPFSETLSLDSLSVSSCLPVYTDSIRNLAQRHFYLCGIWLTPAFLLQTEYLCPLPNSYLGPYSLMWWY